MKDRKGRKSDERINALKERLRRNESWWPYPALIASGLVLVFTNHLVFAISPRTGHPAVVMEYPGQEATATSIWLSVDLKEEKLVSPTSANACVRKTGDVVVSTADRRVFHWSRQVADLRRLDGLTNYLKKKVQEETLNAVLFKQGDETQTRVIIAADECLTYAHIRPILYALAAAGVTDYAFETRQPMLSFKTDYMRDGESTGQTEM